MGSDHYRDARPASTSRLEQPMVRAIVGITMTLGLGLWILAVVSGDPVFQIHAAGSAFTAIVGMAQIVLKRERTYSLVLIAAAVITFNVTLAGSRVTLASSVVALVVTGIGATLFAPKVRLHIVLYASFLVFTMWIWHDRALVAGLLEGLTVGSVFALGAGLIDWIRVRAEISAAGYKHLFRSAPVSLWREDFSRVHEWLTWLRSTGVDDLAQYLDDHPERIGDAAGLIEVTEVNEAAVRLLEADGPEELVGRLNPKGLTEASRSSLRDQLIAIWEGQTDIVTEIRNGRTSRGNRLEGLLSFSIPTLDGKLDYSHVTVAIIDVTESRMARSQLEDLVASKDQLVAAVSHELRTPLTAVVGLAGELAANFHAFTTSEIEEFIRLIAAQSEDVSLIVDDLLVAAQAESGTIHFVAEPTSVPDQIAMALEGFRADVEIPIELPRPIGRAYVDPGRARQIIRNLVTNANRYGSAPIRIVVQATADHVVIEVRDAGPPLAPDQREEIFDRYHRAKERPGVAASVGVGLTVSRELARVMGGDLTYHHDGETVFALTLPKWTGETDRLAG